MNTRKDNFPIKLLQGLGRKADDMMPRRERESQEKKEAQSFFFSKLGLYKQVCVKFTVFKNCKVYAL